MDFGTEVNEIPEVPPTAVITAKQWAAITGVVAKRLGKQEDKREAKQYVAVLKECGYDTIETLRTAVARELRTELGIPLRWGMELLRVAQAISDVTEDEGSDTGAAKVASQLRKGKAGSDSEGTEDEDDEEVLLGGRVKAGTAAIVAPRSVAAKC